MSINYKSINEAVQNNDFSSFNQLNEDDQVEVMKTWTEEMWCNYYTKDSISEQDFLNAMYKIIDET